MDLLGIEAYFKDKYYKISTWLKEPISEYKRIDGVQDVIVYVLLAILLIKQFI